MVFDMLRPTGKTGQTLCAPNDGDFDLGSSNHLCPGGGPGISVGSGSLAELVYRYCPPS
jgi:hypothetical protein